MAESMFNPEKDLASIIIECLGSDGLSITALDSKLSERGIREHRLIITGYLRAMTDLGYLNMRDVPPSKIYTVAKKPPSIYRAVEKEARALTGVDTDEVILYCLYKILKRPIFESEMRLAMTFRPVGRIADPEDTDNSRMLLRKAGNIVPSGNAYVPVNEYPDEFVTVVSAIAVDGLGADHLVLHTKQTKLF